MTILLHVSLQLRAYGCSAFPQKSRTDDMIEVAIAAMKPVIPENGEDMVAIKRRLQ